MWDWSAWQGIGTVASVAVAVWALVSTRGTGRRADEAIVAAGRTATALERMAAAAEALAEAHEAPTPAAAWRVEWLSGEGYLLHNDGTAAALSTRVEAEESQHLPIRFPDAGNMRPGDAHTFMAHQTTATRDTTITVRWTDEDGQEHSWKRPLPPKR